MPKAAFGLTNLVEKFRAQLETAGVNMDTVEVGELSLEAHVHEARSAFFAGVKVTYGHTDFIAPPEF